LVDRQRAAIPAIAPAATKTARPHAVGREAERLGAQLVVADRDHGAAEARVHEGVQRRQERRREHGQGDVVEVVRVLQVRGRAPTSSERARMLRPSSPP
jgi:hypothetical protein